MAGAGEARPSGREEMLALLDGSSTAIASTIEQYVVDPKLNKTRAVDRDDPTVIPLP